MPVIGRDVFPDPAFPLVCRRIASHGNSSILHQHAFHELVVIFSGQGKHLTAVEDYPIQAGDVFLIHGEMGHGYADTRELGLFNILFDPRRLRLPLTELRDVPGYQVLFLVEPNLRERGRFRGRLRLPPRELAEAVALIAQLQEELDKAPPGYRFLARAHLMNLIGFLSRRYSQSRHPDVQPLMRLGEVLSFIERQAVKSSLSVKQLAEMAHMSESSLTRVFRKLTGHSPLDYVIRVRLARASEMIQRGERITEAAFQCGFNDSNYFSRQFKRMTGQTPREFQRAKSE